MSSSIQTSTYWRQLGDAVAPLVVLYAPDAGGLTTKVDTGSRA